MKKPRVIVADTDWNYILSIQNRFITMFADRIQLEIITEKIYFDELFSSPQHVDILLVSDRLYNASLKKHDIRKLLILAEKYEVGQTDELDIHKLYKYTNIQEIFREIVGKCREILYTEENKNKTTQIILVTSAVGGTGKTSVALGLCRCLERNYKHTLYVNAERLHTFQWFMENQEPLRDARVYARMANPTQNIYYDIKDIIRKEEFSYLPPFKASLMSLAIPYQIFGDLVKSVCRTKEYDYIIIDTDCTFDAEKARLMDLADKVIFLTEQAEHAAQATNSYVMNMNRSSSEKYLFVCNKFRKEEKNALLFSNLMLKFAVSEYIEYIFSQEQLRYGLPFQTLGLQRLMFLIT